MRRYRNSLFQLALRRLLRGRWPCVVGGAVRPAVVAALFERGQLPLGIEELFRQIAGMDLEILDLGGLRSRLLYERLIVVLHGDELLLGHILATQAGAETTKREQAAHAKHSLHDSTPFESPLRF